MNHFPMFLNLAGRRVLICGGGRHAQEKIARLLPFSPRLHVICARISDEIKAMDGIVTEERPFCAGDLEPAPAFVVVAEEPGLSEQIAALCRARHIPVNAVDLPELCDFIFPSLVCTQQLCVGVSTGGASPTAAIYLKEQIGDLLPSHIDEILQWLPQARQTVKHRLPEAEVRRTLRALVERAFAEDRPLADGELETFLKNP